MIYETQFLISLGVTSVIEVPLAFLIVKFLFKLKKKWWEILGVAFLVSLLTLPYLWFVMPPYFDARLYVYIGEGIVILAETFLYFWFLRLKIPRAFALSVVLNFISYYLGIGLLRLLY